MADKDLANIDNLEVTALSDEELDSVAGGETDVTTASSCTCCASGAQTNIGATKPTGSIAGS